MTGADHGVWGGTCLKLDVRRHSYIKIFRVANFTYSRQIKKTTGDGGILLTSLKLLTNCNG